MNLDGTITSEKEPHLGGNIRGIDNHTYCPVVWDYLITKFAPESIFDVGCGEGHLLSYFNEKGITCFGSEGLKENVDLIPQEFKYNIAWNDYVKKMLLPIRVDMTISCEFVEHVESCFIPNFLPQFCACKYLVFTHAVPNQEGWHHVNCKDDNYWIRLIEYFGFTLMVEETFDVRMLGKDTFWTSTLIFKNEHDT